MSDLSPSPAASRKRREYRLERIATALGRKERTIRRWLAEYPELRRVLRAERLNGQWRLAYPKTEAGFVAYVRQASQAVAKFTKAPLPPPPHSDLDLRKQSMERTREKADRRAGKALHERTHTMFNEYFGLGDPIIERDSETLRLAMRTKRLSRLLPSKEQREEPEPDDDFRWCAKELEEWQAEIAEMVVTARRVALHFGCPVKQAIRLWPAFLEAKGKLAETIQEEVKNVAFFWPEEADWAKAERAKVRAWEIRTLAEAALELVCDGKPVTAENLRPLLYLLDRDEMEYRNHWFRREEEPKLAGLAYFWFGQPHLARSASYAHKPFERASPCFGERGISRAEFFKRYDLADIANAEREALAAANFDINRGSKPQDDEETHDETEQTKEMSRLDETGRPVEVPAKNRDGTVGTRGHQKPAPVEPTTAARVRRDLRACKAELDALRPEERAAIERELGCSLDDYVRDPFQGP